MQDFRNLEVWSKAHRIALEAYRLTDNFPRSEMFGLSSQIAVRPLRFQRISLRVVGGRSQSLASLCRSHWDQTAN